MVRKIRYLIAEQS